MPFHTRLPRRRSRFVAPIIVALLVAACGATTPLPPTPPGHATSSSNAPSSNTSPGTLPGGASPGASFAAGSASPACGNGGSSPPASGHWWSNRVFYEVFVRSFQDSNGDGTGDLRGLTQRLDYLNDGNPATTTDLGVTALWLMPVTQASSYHGYDVVDYRMIEKDYGSNADFRTLVAQAHKRGIDVIVDLVLNHTSAANPWFKDALTPGSPHDAWYVWSKADPGYSGPGGMPVWHPANGRYYYGYFGAGMPDLNYRNPAVTTEVGDIARFWLDNMDVDGFRLDAAKYLVEDGRQLENTPETLTWLSTFRNQVGRDKADPLVLGEVWDSTSIGARYVQQGALDLDFEFDLASAFVDGIRLGDAGTVQSVLTNAVAAYPPGGLASFLTNHDQARVFDELGRNVPAAKLAATLLLTSPGVPFIYYGEEIGLDGRKPDERIRAPMRWDETRPAAGFSSGAPWEALGDDRPGRSVAAESADPNSLLSLYRALISLRAAHPALATGEYVPVKASDSSVLAFLRSGPGETDLIVANLGEVPVANATLDLAVGPLCSPVHATVLLGSGSVGDPTLNPAGGFERYQPAAELGPRDALVIRLAP